MFGVHNHALDSKLKGHLIVDILNNKENKFVVTMNLIVNQNNLIYFKRKIYGNVTNNKQVCNIHYRNNKSMCLSG